MKKQIIVVIALLLTGTFTHAQWQWVKTIGGPATETSAGLLLAPNGYIYCGGSYRTEDLFVDTFHLNGTGFWNAFLVKYTTDGDLVTITGARGFNSQNDMINFGSIAADENSNIYACGSRTGAVLADTIYVPDAPSGCFMAKFNDDTRCLWTKVSGNSISSLGAPIYYNHSIYTSGFFSGDSINLDTIHLNNPGSWAEHKSFRAKFDTMGYCKWAKAAMGGLTDFTNFKRNKNFFYSSGRTDSCFIYDTLNICNTNPTGADVIFKADTNGSVQWSANLSSTKPFGIATLSVDGAGNIYITCAYDSICQLGDTTLLQQVDTAKYATFMMKYDTLGNVVWIKQWFATGELNPNAAYTDNNGYTYITGFFNDEISLGGDTISSESSSDMFVARIDPDGNCLGLISVSHAMGNRIIQDSIGNAIIAGKIYEGGTSMFGEISATSAGDADFFVAKLGAITGGLPRLAINETLRIYANPNAGNFTIEVPKELVSSNHLHLGIYDTAGKTVKDEEVDISNEKLNVELGLITKGIYTVTLSKGHKKFTGRVVVE